MSEMSPNPGTQQEEQNKEGGFSRLKTIGVLSGALLLASGGYAAGKLGEDSPEHRGEAAASVSEENSSLSESAGELARGKFLPASEDGQINSDNEAESYTKEFFDGNGPLANEINPASLSIVDALIVEPATSKDVDTTLDVQSQFVEDMTNLNKEGDTALASELSAASRAILNTDGRYDAQAVSNGDQYTEVAPVFNNTGDIVNVKFERHVAKHDTPALVYKARGEESVTVNGEEVDVSGYGDVILPGDGSIWIKGHLPQPKPSKKKGPEKAPNGNQKDDERAPSGTSTQTQAPNGGSNTGNNANNSPGNGTGGGANETTGACGGCGTGTSGGGGSTGTCGNCGSGTTTTGTTTTTTTTTTPNPETPPPTTDEGKPPVSDANNGAGPSPAMQ